MLKTTQELQDFILWAKKERIKSFKIGPTEVQFSDLAFLEAIPELEPNSTFSQKTEEKDTSKTLVDTEQAENEDDLLFWSAKP